MASDEVRHVVRVRGKRTATFAEKWNTGKRRKPKLQRRPLSSNRAISNTTASSPALPASKSFSLLREPASASRLETLPVELLQYIFISSGNVDLPLASPILADKLCSSHLHFNMAERLLTPVLGILQANHPQISNDTTTPTATDLVNATRFLNCRFVTLRWFRYCCARLASSPPLRTSMSQSDEWAGLDPSPALMPPKKLLRGPFNRERAEFLAVFGRNVQDFSKDAYYSELAQRGLSDAVQDVQIKAVSAFISFGVKPDIEHLRAAVIDHGCDKDIVQTLLTSAFSDVHGSEDNSLAYVDPLDYMLWRWIDNAQEQGNEKAGWLKDLLIRHSEDIVDSSV